MKVYIAGPDIFRPDVEAWAASVRAACAEFGLQPLLPLDGCETTPQGIYAANRQLLAQADAVLTNLSPFRGQEPDSGTCVEVGIALALGKPVVGYLSEIQPMIARLGAVSSLGGPFVTPMAGP